MSQKLLETANADHTIKASLDAVVNQVRGFYPTIKERSQFIHAWKIKTFVAGQKEQKMSQSNNPIDRDNLEREIVFVKEDIQGLEERIAAINDRICSEIEIIFAQKLTKDLNKILVSYARTKTQQLLQYRQSFDWSNPKSS
jgi:hypothetical protein